MASERRFRLAAMFAALLFIIASFLEVALFPKVLRQKLFHETRDRPAVISGGFFGGRLHLIGNSNRYCRCFGHECFCVQLTFNGAGVLCTHLHSNATAPPRT
jgi:hypothetical protein